MEEKFKRKRFPLRGRPRHLRLLALVLSYNLLIIVFMAFSLFAPDVLELWDQTASFRDQAAAADQRQCSQEYKGERQETFFGHSPNPALALR